MREASPNAGGHAPGARVVRVWDPLLRVFHWTLAACVAIALVLEAGTDLHEAVGYVVLGLLAFRLLWGFVGPRRARFADFVRGPGAIAAYLRDLAGGRPQRHLGHNPAGGAMVVVLLATLAVVAGSGAIMDTDRFWGVAWIEELHETAASLLYALVPLHVLGVVVSSLLHQENLVRAMIHGYKPALESEDDI